MPTPVLTPTGRLVQGDFFKPNTTNQQGEPLVVKSGPNKGQPRSDYFGALAFPKTDPGALDLIGKFVAQAALSYAAMFPNGPQPSNAAGNWGCTLPKFSWKVMDGDGLDDNGKPNASKPGFAGHWVVKFSSGFAPQVWTRAKNLPDGHAAKALNPDPETLVQLTVADAGLCKRGYYYRVNGSIDGNGQQLPSGSPGLYTNYNLVELVSYGEEIISGPVAAEVFGAPAGSVPINNSGVASPPVPAPGGGLTLTAKAGATTLDQFRTAGWTDEALVREGYATRPLAAPATSTAPAPVAAPPPPTPAAPPPPAPTASPSDAPPPPPHEGFMHVMTAKAAGKTFDQFIAAGWTEAQLKEQGYLA